MAEFRISLKDSAGAPIAGVTARLHISSASNPVAATTDASGVAHWKIGKGGTHARLEIAPIPGHWSVSGDWDMKAEPARNVQATPLPLAQNSTGWWHRAVGVSAGSRARGKGIKVGIIDTGCGPHPALSHVVPLGTFFDTEQSEGIDDESAHGSHVAGIVAARPVSINQFGGVAPECELLVARVSRAGRYVNQADIADALDAMIAEGVHLVNISFSARDSSPTLTESIVDAWTNGVVCVASAGNMGEDVLWPAQHELVVAVTALGREAEVPPGSLGHLLLQGCHVFDKENDFAFPNFCSRGLAVNCCAPGVGIISTLPGLDTPPAGNWGDMSGSSMASPLALGVLAAALSADHEFLAMPGDEDRSKRAVEVLRDRCLPLAFNEDCQGNGLPVLESPWFSL